jgi:hypothetical protein
MAEELNIVTPEGAETTAPSFHEKIGNMTFISGNVYLNLCRLNNLLLSALFCHMFVITI